MILKDPYKILNCHQSVTDEQLKQIYRRLAKKYHPDRYADSPLAEEAAEKMKEINAAYNQIMEERRNAPGYVQQDDYAVSCEDDGFYADIEKLINSERYKTAEKTLGEIYSSDRKGEWYYYSALLSYKKGWLEEAYNYIDTACTMDRKNKKYIALYEKISENRQAKKLANSDRNKEFMADAGEVFCDFLECLGDGADIFFCN